ncbi:MAG TPA: GTP-binding protein, partial [Xanthobacteraceae bacterium]|nr:GTP-binding protein [Xanthobacteraceae bacterium]
MPDFTPVILITGCLGSGKTTLLQRLLREPALADTAVLINEFGEIGLDHHLLERIDDTMVLLQSGCLCCTIRGELSAAIKDLHAKRERGVVPAFRRLVIESTGLADPLPILSTVHADPVLKHHFRLGPVIVTVDAVNAMGQLDRQPESIKQVAVADRVVLTKTDLAAAAMIDMVADRIRRINPAATLRRSADQDVDAQALLSPGAFDGNGAERWIAADVPPKPDSHQHGDRNRHGDDIRAVAFSLDDAIDWTTFGIWLTMLLNRHGNAVLRVKGILNVAGTDTPVAVHGVQHLVHPPTHMRAWPDADRRSRLVFIVRGLDPQAIERSLRTF